MAGGLNPNADIDNIFITYPSGISRKYSRWLSNHKIKDGSIISVGIKPEEDPFDITTYAKDVTQILVNFAQAISILIIANQN